MKIAIIGLGYVGIPLAIAAVNGGVEVIGYDISIKVMTHLSAKKSHLKHIADEDVKNLVENKFFRHTNDPKNLAYAEYVIICVPTPLKAGMVPDLSFVESAVQTICDNFVNGQTVILESSTYPGTTDNLVAGIFSKNDIVVYRDVFLAYSPEREDPGNKSFHTASIPKLVGSCDQTSLKKATAMYEMFIDNIIPVESAGIAEAAKILENTFRAVNIALVNELKVLFARLGIDIWKVVAAASTKPFGFMPFYPGPGLGGHCIPIDPYYLSYLARSTGGEAKFIELAGEINSAMPEYVVNQLLLGIALRLDVPISKVSIKVVGVSYKRDIDDFRESPSLEIIKKLSELGVVMKYFDPWTDKHEFESFIEAKCGFKIESEEVIEGDVVLLVTDHSSLDYKDIFNKATMIVDTRNAFADFTSEKIIKA